MADTEKDEYWGRNAYGGYGDARDPNKPSGMQAETTRYANMGQDAANRTAYNANYDQYNSYMGASNDARGTQNNALGLIAQRANGGTPSAAEIAGKNAQDQALASTIAAAGTARGGPMQTAAAVRSATGGLAAQNQGLTNTIQAGRANEIANAQDAYMRGAGDIRSGDFQGAGLGLQQTGQDIQNQQFQRGLNQQAQENYEQQRQKVYEDQLQANQNAQQESDAAWTAKRGAQMQDEQNTWGKVKDIAGTVVGGAMGAVGSIFGSDERMKSGITPMGMGSLSGLGMTGMSGDSSPTGSMAVKGGGMDVMGSLAKTNAINTQYIHSPAGGMMRSDEKTKTGARKMTDADVQKDVASTQKRAGEEVDARRKAGGYAQLDMSPIASSLTDPGYTSQNDRNTTTRLHSAIERDTEGATPYAGGAPSGDPDPEDRFGLANAQEFAHIREQHPAMKLDEKGNAQIVGRSPGEQAQMQHDAEVGTPGSRVGNAFMNMGGNILSGVFSGGSPHSSFDYSKYMPLGRETTISDARAKEEAFQAGHQAGLETAVQQGTANGTLAGNRIGEELAHPQPESADRGKTPEPDASKFVRRATTLVTGPGSAIYSRALGADPDNTPEAIRFPRGVENEGKRHIEGTYTPLKHMRDGSVHNSSEPDAIKLDVGPGSRVLDLAASPTIAPRVDVTSGLGRPEPVGEYSAKDPGGTGRDVAYSDEDTKEVHSYMDGSGVVHGARKDASKDHGTYDTNVYAQPGHQSPAQRRDLRSAGQETSGHQEMEHRSNRDAATSDERAKVVIQAEEPMRRAALAMEPSAYKYKPEFTPQGQDAGEVNIGPMAQNMAKDPVAKTAIVQDEKGLLGIDKEKALKLALGSLASLQHQIDALVEAKHRRSA